MPTYAALAHMKNVTVDGLQVNIDGNGFNAFPRSALALVGVDGAQLARVFRTPATGAPPVVEQTDCQQVNIK